MSVVTAITSRTRPRGGRKFGIPCEVLVLVLPPSEGAMALAARWQEEAHRAPLLRTIQDAGGRILSAGHGDMRHRGLRSAFGQALARAREWAEREGEKMRQEWMEAPLPCGHGPRRVEAHPEEGWCFTCYYAGAGFEFGGEPVW